MNWNGDDLDLALRELRDEELPLGAVEAVRARVMAEVAAPRRRWWMWAWAPALAAMLLIIWLIPRPAVPPPPVIAKAPAAPPHSIAGTAATGNESRHIVPATGRERVKPVAPASEFVKLVTDDPDVVILWAMNSEGDSQ